MLIDLPFDVALARVDGRRDRIEAEDEAFHRRVADGYRALAAADPGLWTVVDGQGSIDEVAARVREAVERRVSARR